MVPLPNTHTHTRTRTHTHALTLHNEPDRDIAFNLTGVDVHTAHHNKGNGKHRDYNRGSDDYWPLQQGGEAVT